MKRAHNTYNIEYIIGGIGSTFRRSILKKVGYYDTNTITEDIDLTMKILQLGNKVHLVHYGADVIAYTESVLDITGLVRQRFRWKWGRCQTFLKNLNLFFNREDKLTKSLTFFYLPYTIFSDIAFFFEPLIISYILYIIFKYSDFLTIFSAFLTISAYICLNVLSEDTMDLKDKLLLILVAPVMYFYFYLLSFVEYIALIKAVIKLPHLKESLGQQTNPWHHVARLGLN